MKITNFGRVPTGVGGGTGGVVGGDLGGTLPGPTVTGLLGDPIDGAPADGDILRFDAASGHWQLVAPPSVPPTGLAGGDLAGTYPNPIVARINGAPLGTTTGAATDDWLRWTGSAWAKDSRVWRPLMATGAAAVEIAGAGPLWWPVVDGAGNAVMVLG